MTTTIKKRNRRRERGAALVEAAVVIPVMLVFLGLIMFTHRSYETKLNKQLGTRAGVLYYASHACKGDIPADVVPSVDNTDPGIPATAGGNNPPVGSSNSAATTAGVKRSWNLVKAQPKDTEVKGTAVQDRTTVGLSRQIHAASEVGCNEETFPNKWTAVFKEIGSLYRSGGGFVN
jgi:Flp pilus assembly protein TadG